jgi:hypothetical protein
MVVQFTTTGGEKLYETNLDVVPVQGDVVLFPSGRVATVGWRTFSLDQQTRKTEETVCIVTVGPVR